LVVDDVLTFTLSRVESTGQMGSVFTVYELLEGDDTTKEDFHGIEQELMIKILTFMEQQVGNAKLFTATDPSKIGVKIFK
jgi:ESCRT-II complex subunit VPS25